MKIKPGASISGLRPEMVLGLVSAEQVFIEHAMPMVITSGTDGTHSSGSLHYVGLACDLRAKQMPLPAVKNIVAGLREALGAEFDVVLETKAGAVSHIHIEYQPKTNR